MNGEIECFTGSHISLGLLAIIVLLIAILLIPCIWLIATERLKLVKLYNYIAPLFRTPFAQIKLSLTVRCPDFRHC